jgi:recombinase-like zinc beta ribbon protein
MIETPRSLQRKHLARSWELRGVLRCGSCGILTGTHTVGASAAKTDKIYHYYKRRAGTECKRGLCSQKMIRAENVEAEVWDFVSGLLKEPERIRTGMQQLIEQERSAGFSDTTEEIAA